MCNHKIIPKINPNHRLGAGSYGVAYKLGDMVVKLTTSPEEFENAKQLRGKKLKHVRRIFYCGELCRSCMNRFEGEHSRFYLDEYETIWYIVGERLDPIDEYEIHQDSDGSHDYWDCTYEHEHPECEVSRLINNVNKELNKYGLYWHDTHEGNILRDPRTHALKAIDIQ